MVLLLAVFSLRDGDDCREIAGERMRGHDRTEYRWGTMSNSENSECIFAHEKSTTGKNHRRTLEMGIL